MEVLSIIKKMSGRACYTELAQVGSKPHQNLLSPRAQSRGLCFLICFGLLLCTSCQPEMKGDADRFKLGIFEARAVKGQSKTIIIRKDSLQIEKYTKYTEISTDSGVFVKEEERIDTFHIEWKNNFFYTCKMISPRNESDKIPFFYQITKITEDSYDFSLKFGYSKYKQKGTVYKVK